MIEAGIADFTSVSFTGVVAPVGTPGAIVDRLNAAINASLHSPEIAGTLIKLGVDAKISSPGSSRLSSAPSATSGRQS